MPEYINILTPQDEILLKPTMVSSRINVDTDIIEMYVYTDSISPSLIKDVSTSNLKKFIESKGEELSTYFKITEDTKNNQYLSFDEVLFFSKFYPNFSRRIQIVFNFLKEVSSSETDDITTYEISPSRYETRQKYIYSTEPDFFNSKLSEFNEKNISLDDSLYINFKDNRLSAVVNLYIESSDSCVFRYYEPVDSTISINQISFICKKVATSVKINANIISSAVPQEELLTSLRPDFSIKVNQVVVDSTFKNLNDLKGSSTQKSYIDSFLSSSIEELNIDYSDYKNFVFYSSAEQRIRNFVYKLSKIELYDQEATTHSSSVSYLNSINSGSYFVSQSWIATDALKHAVLSSFTPYERYLYYESSSYSTSSLGEKFDASWPKSTSNTPYSLYTVSSSKAIDWYTNQLATASIYDLNNINSIQKTLPQYILEDFNNNDYIKFINMIAEYFDELKLYISNITNRNVNALSPNEGPISQIAFKLIQQFGAELVSDIDAEELYNYLIKNDVSNFYTSTTNQKKKNLLFKRFFNNIMYFLKSKGTLSSLESMINLHGIDKDYYELREYTTTDKTYLTFSTSSIPDISLKYTNLDYSLKFDGQQNVKLLWKNYSSSLDSKKPDSIIVKFKINDSSLPSQSIYESLNNFALVVEKTGSFSTDGRIKFMLSGTNGILSASTSIIPIFDGNFWNVLVQRSVSTSSINLSQTYTLKANNVKFDTINNYVSQSLYITASLTSSYNTSFNADASFYVGGVTSSIFTGASGLLRGNVSNLKFYTEILRDDIFKLHSLAESTAVTNETTSSYENLVTWLKFKDNKNLAQTSSVYDSNTSPYGKNHATASGFTSNTFQDRYETYILKTKALGSNEKATSTKVLIDNTYVTHSDGYTYLSSTENIEPNNLINLGENSNKIDLIFSPTNIENKNILLFLNPQVADYISHPKFMIDDEGSYKELNDLLKYYRKYNTIIDLQNYIFNAYLLSKNLFKNIKQFSPSKADFNAGVSIEPTILERTNIVLNKSARISNLTYTSSILTQAPNLNSLYTLYTSSISSSKQVFDSQYLTYNSIITTQPQTPIMEYKTFSKTINVYLNINESASYLFKGTGTLLTRDDRIFTQGIKLKNNITSFVTSSNGPNFYTITKAGVYEIATSSVVLPISDFKYTPTYNTSSGEYYYKRNSAMEPLTNGTYAPNHIRYYRYMVRSPFIGSLNTGPEYPSGATTIDGGKVVEITFVSPNKISVVSDSEDKPRLKVDGINLDI